MNITLKMIDQQVFSNLSNDYNPIHLDYEYSKKSPYSKPVIYGILIVLKSLDNLDFVSKKKFENIKVEFIKFINVDDDINIEYNN